MKPESNNIYRDKRRRHNNKNTSKAVVSAVLTVVVVGGIVLLGYKIGEPLINYLDNGGSGNSSSNTDNLISNDSENSSYIQLDSSGASSQLETSSSLQDITESSSHLDSSSILDSLDSNNTSTDTTTDSSTSSISESNSQSSSSSINNSSSKADSGSSSSIGGKLHLDAGNSNQTNSSASNSDDNTSKDNSSSTSSNNNSNNNNNNSSSSSTSDSKTDFHTNGNNVDPGQKDGTGGGSNSNTAGSTNATYSSSTFNGYSLNVGDLKNISTLNTAIKNAGSKGSFKNIVVPLKLVGGKIYYKSGVSGAINSGAVIGTLKLSEIVNAITSQGYIPIAEISTLEDSTYAIAYADAGYSFADGSSHWYDNSVEKGGKPWLSPQSDLTKTYLTQLVNEITSAGFKGVICSDVNYPNFRDSDLELIGSSVKASNRYKALIDLVSELDKTASVNNARIMVRIPAAYIINGKAEIVKTAEFPANVTIVPLINYEDISADMQNKTIQIVNSIKAKTGNLDIIPCINAGGKDVSKAVTALQGIGYTEYIIK